MFDVIHMSFGTVRWDGSVVGAEEEEEEEDVVPPPPAPRRGGMKRPRDDRDRARDDDGRPVVRVRFDEETSAIGATTTKVVYVENPRYDAEILVPDDAVKRLENDGFIIVKPFMNEVMVNAILRDFAANPNAPALGLISTNAINGQMTSGGVRVTLQKLGMANTNRMLIIVLKRGTKDLAVGTASDKLPLKEEQFGDETATSHVFGANLTVQLSQESEEIAQFEVWPGSHKVGGRVDEERVAGRRIHLNPGYALIVMGRTAVKQLSVPDVDRIQLIIDYPPPILDNVAYIMNPMFDE